MSEKTARDYLESRNAAGRIRRLDTSTATVSLAASAIGCEEARIAKTVSLLGPDGKAVLVVTCGDTKIDNKKYKQQVGIKAKMIPFDRVEEMTGHAPGGVCPFGAPEGTIIYIDSSLRRFDTVFPAAGSEWVILEASCDELIAITGGTEADLCSVRQPDKDQGC